MEVMNLGIDCGIIKIEKLSEVEINFLWRYKTKWLWKIVKPQNTDIFIDPIPTSLAMPNPNQEEIYKEDVEMHEKKMKKWSSNLKLEGAAIHWWTARDLVEMVKKGSTIFNRVSYYQVLYDY